MMNNQHPPITEVTYEPVIWMQPLEAVNDKRTFLLLGKMLKINDVDATGTLVVTPKGENGGSLFYCQKHHFVYKIHEACRECLNQVVDEAPEAAVTACNTPEN